MMRKYSHTRRGEKRGFTVVEMLIALTLLLIIGSMTALIFRSTQESFINAKAFQHIIDLARQTVMRMHNEIKATFIDSAGKANLVGIDAAGAPLKTDSQEDEIYFIAPDKISREGDICEIGFWQHNDGNIMRHYECPPDFNFSTVGTDNKLGLIISYLDFAYYDGTNYLDSWDTRQGGAQEGVFPKAIKFQFLVSDETQLIKRKFESFVRIASSGR